MARTEAQREADDKLSEAIQNVLNAYQDEAEHQYFMSDYLVICAQSRIDEDGDSETAYNYLYRNGSLPTHTILGLLDIARGRIQSHANME